MSTQEIHRIKKKAKPLLTILDLVITIALIGFV